MEVPDRTTVLDEAAFAALEAAGQVALSDKLRSQISNAVSDYPRFFEFSLSLSPESRHATEVLAKRGKEVLRAVEHLKQTPAALLALLYEEGSALAVFFHGEQIDPNRHGDTMLSELPRLLVFLEELVEGATRRKGEIDILKPKRHPANTHTDVLCRRMAEIFEEAGGSTSINGERVGPFARFLSELWKHLPSELRPTSPDAIVAQARRALRPFRRRQRDQIGQVRSDGPDKLDEAFTRALKARGEG